MRSQVIRSSILSLTLLAILVFLPREASCQTDNAEEEKSQWGTNAENSQGVGSKKEPGVAFLYSLILTGGGQAYNGEWGKGVLMLGTTVLGLILYASNRDRISYYPNYKETSAVPGLSTFGLGLALAASLWSVIDAPISANRINKKNGWANNEKPRLKLNLADLSRGEKISPGLRLLVSF